MSTGLCLRPLPLASVRTRIKVCCISSAEEAALAVALGADALGLVAEMPSGPGVIADADVARIARGVPPPISRFLLSARRSGADLAAHALACGVDTLQVVAHVEADAHAQIAAAAPPVRRVQVVHVTGAASIEVALAYAPHVHALLLDSGRPDAAVPELGGTGRTHDWAHSAEIVRRSPVPVFLAGGLGPANVGDAIAAVRPYGVDLCSGVRTAGRLDGEKLAAFVAAVRGA